MLEKGQTEMSSSRISQIFGIKVSQTEPQQFGLNIKLVLFPILNCLYLWVLLHGTSFNKVKLNSSKTRCHLISITYLKPIRRKHSQQQFIQPWFNSTFSSGHTTFSPWVKSKPKFDPTQFNRIALCIFGRISRY